MVFFAAVGFVVARLGCCFFHELSQMLLASFGFDHICVIAGFEDEVAFVFTAVEVEAFYIMAGVA